LAVPGFKPGFEFARQVFFHLSHTVSLGRISWKLVVFYFRHIHVFLHIHTYTSEYIFCLHILCICINLGSCGNC
jgi:hypothetical protein